MKQENLPMSYEEFKELFSYLNIELGEKGCGGTLKLTETFLTYNSPTKFDEVIKWLEEKGGYCDCEVMMNVNI